MSEDTDNAFFTYHMGEMKKYGMCLGVLKGLILIDALNPEAKDYVIRLLKDIGEYDE